jgi:hypothetical protein
MFRLGAFLLAALALHAADVNTFSIVGYDPVNGDWGVAVASRYFSVGAVVPWAEADVGAIATQANVNVGYGPRGLELLRQGLSARQTLDKLLAEDQFPGKDGRQVAIVDGHGNIAAYTGPGAPQWAGGPAEENVAGARQHSGGTAGGRRHGRGIRIRAGRAGGKTFRGPQSG